MNRTRRMLCLLLAAVLCLSLCGCGAQTLPQSTEAPAGDAAKDEALPQFEDFPDSYRDALPENAADGLTLHAFNWTYDEIRENLDAIRDAGFKNVLTMPVQQPKSGGSDWWTFYQPLSFSIGERSALGSKEDLIALCREAGERGICILADIVANHTANIDDDAKESDGTPTVYPGVEEYEPELYRNRNEDVDGIGVTFHHNRLAKGSGADTQVYAWGNLPDLDTSNPYVQQRVLALLEECIDAGVDGFRFDAAKHIETSLDPDYPSDFWEKTVDEAKRYYREKTGGELYVYGEILDAPSGRSLSNYTAHMRITDDGYTAQFKNAFATKDPGRILNASLKTGDANELIAWVESHDEYVTTNTHYSDLRVAKLWSVIAAKKGLGGLYLARPTEELTVGSVGSYAFESEYVAVSNRFHNRFFDADSFESVDGSCYINEKIKPDDQGALILNVGDAEGGEIVTLSVPHLEDGNYYDALSGALVVVSDHVAYVPFEPSGMVVLTRSKDIHPRLEISERGGSFAGNREITLKAQSCDEAWYSFNGEEARTPIDGTAVIALEDHVKDGKVELHVTLRNGVNVLDRVFTYRQLQLIEGYFNVVNLPEQVLNGDYELYMWSWSPGVWSKDYEIRDGVLLVDTSGMTGFLLAVFEKGYEITDPLSWDSHVIKQSADIKGDILKEGFFDLSGF